MVVPHSMCLDTQRITLIKLGSSQTNHIHNRGWGIRFYPCLYRKIDSTIPVPSLNFQSEAVSHYNICVLDFID
jgi:hypothetical protein